MKQRDNKKNTSKKIFVCSPFSGDEVGNYKLANHYMYFVKYYGNIPFAPHTMYPGAFPENEKGNRDFGISCGLTFLRDWADELWYFKGENGISKGMQAEIDYAKKIGIEIKDMTKSAKVFLETKEL